MICYRQLSSREIINHRKHLVFQNQNANFLLAEEDTAEKSPRVIIQQSCLMSSHTKEYVLPLRQQGLRGVHVNTIYVDEGRSLLGICRK